MKNLFDSTLMRKVTAGLITAAMTVTSLPFTAFAAGTGTGADTTPTITKNASWVDGEDNLLKVDLTLKAPEDYHQSETSYTTTDIVVVFDASTSMGEKLNSTTRMRAAKAAIKAFAQNVLALNTDEAEYVKIGLVSFDNDADTKQALTSNLSNFTQAVDKLQSGGGTNTAGGLLEAQEMLEKSTAANKYVILLTDGAPTRSYKGTETDGTYITKFGKEQSGNGTSTNTNYTIENYFFSKEAQSGYDKTSVYKAGNSYFLYNRVEVDSKYVSYDYSHNGWKSYYTYAKDNSLKVTSHAQAAISAGKLLKDDGAVIYGIDFATTSNSSTQQIATSASHYSNAGDSTALGNILDAIRSEVTTSISYCVDAVVTDSTLTSANGVFTEDTNAFTWVDNETYKPSATAGSAPSYNNGTVTWNAGTVNETVTATYYLRLSKTAAELYNNAASVTLFDKGTELDYSKSVDGTSEKQTTVTGSGSPVSVTSYKVTWDSDNGAAAAEDYYFSGKQLVVPANPTKTGTRNYTFSGWTENNAAVTFEDGETVTADRTLKAAYTEDVTIRFYNNNTLLNVGNTTFNVGDSVTAPSVESTAYQFLGWKDSSGNVVTPQTTAVENADYYAYFSEKAITYTATFIFMDADGKQTQQTVSGSYGEQVVVPNINSDYTLTTQTGDVKYTFTNWDLTPPATFTANTTHTAQYNDGEQVTASYVIRYEVVDVNGNPFTSVDAPTGASGTAGVNTTVSAPTTAPEGFALHSVSASSITISADQANEIIVKVIPKFTVTFMGKTNDGTAVIDKVLHTDTYLAGAVLTAPEADSYDEYVKSFKLYNWAFSQWNTTLPETVTQTATYTAEYTATPYVKFFLRDPGQGLPTSGISIGTNNYTLVEEILGSFTYDFAKDLTSAGNYSLDGINENLVEGKLPSTAKIAEALKKYGLPETSTIIWYVAKNETDDDGFHVDGYVRKQSVTVNYYLNGALQTEDSTSTDYVSSSVITINPIAKYNAYTFDYLTLDGNRYSSAALSVTVEASDIVINYYFKTSNNVTVNYFLDGNSYGTSAVNAHHYGDEYSYFPTGTLAENANYYTLASTTVNGATAAEPYVTGTMEASDVNINYYYTTNMYTVTFLDANGSTVLSTGSYVYNTALTAPENSVTIPAVSEDDTSYTEYFFSHWSESGSDQTYTSNEIPAVTKNVTYVAVISDQEKNMNAVIWDFQNGTTNTTTYHMPNTAVSKLSVTPTKTADAAYSYEFSYWAFDEAGTQPVDFSSFTSAEPTITVYAIYTATPVDYTVTTEYYIDSVLQNHFTAVQTIANGSNYTTNGLTASDINLDAYTVTTPDNASGTVNGANVTVRYYYTSKQFSVTVNYYLDGEKLDSKTQINIGTNGVAYTTTGLAEYADRASYSLATDGVLSGKIGTSDIEVNYYYTTIYYTVTTEYYLDNTLVGSNVSYKHANGSSYTTTSNSDYDDSETYSLTIPSNAAGTINGADVTVPYHYTTLDYTVTAEYYINGMLNGNLTQVTSYNNGDSYTTSALTDEYANSDSYKLEIVGAESGAINGANVTVRYYYTALEYTVTVQHYLDDTLVNSSNNTYNNGDSYTTSALDTYADTNAFTTTVPENADGSINGSDVIVRYDYATINYTVQFVDETNVQLAIGNYTYGSAVTNIPQQDDYLTETSETTYSIHSFTGWLSSVDNVIYASDEIPNVTANAIYTAVYTVTNANKFTVTWIPNNGDETIIDYYMPNDQIVVPADPTRASDEYNDYFFNGWLNTDTNEITIDFGNINSDLTFSAQYSDEALLYNVIYRDYDGTEIQATENLTYSEIASVAAPADPTRDSENGTYFIFSGWTSSVEGRTFIFTAGYTPYTYIIPVIPDDDDNDDDQQQTVIINDEEPAADDGLIDGSGDTDSTSGNTSSSDSDSSLIINDEDSAADSSPNTGTGFSSAIVSIALLSGATAAACVFGGRKKNRK